MALSARQKVLQKHVQLTNFPINQSVSAGGSNASVGNNESANMQNPYLMRGHLPLAQHAEAIVCRGDDAHAPSAHGSKQNAVTAFAPKKRQNVKPARYGSAQAFHRSMTLSPLYTLSTE